MVITLCYTKMLNKVLQLWKLMSKSRFTQKYIRPLSVTTRTETSQNSSDLTKLQKTDDLKEAAYSRSYQKIFEDANIKQWTSKCRNDDALRSSVTKGIPTSQKHLLQQTVDVCDPKQLGELNLFDHLPRDALQRRQAQEQLTESNNNIKTLVYMKLGKNDDVIFTYLNTDHLNLD